MKKILLPLLVAVLLSACASIEKVEGEQIVNQRMAVKLSDAWNKFPGGTQPYDTWTQEGLSLDQLRLWAAVKPGEPLSKMQVGSVPSGQKAPRVPTFASGMTPDQLVGLFETMYAMDGSMVRVTRIEPGRFGGENGFRFEFDVDRKRDHVELAGVGWVALRKGELFAATFVAPKLSFYPRLLPKVEAIVKTAQIR